MDSITKQLRKIPLHDRQLIEEALRKLYRGDTKTLHLQKLRGFENIYRIRSGNYRIIYYQDKSKIILKAIKRRNEKTYKF